MPEFVDPHGLTLCLRIAVGVIPVYPDCGFNLRDKTGPRRLTGVTVCAIILDRCLERVVCRGATRQIDISDVCPRGGCVLDLRTVRCLVSRGICCSKRKGRCWPPAVDTERVRQRGSERRKQERGNCSRYPDSRLRHPGAHMSPSPLKSCGRYSFVLSASIGRTRSVAGLVARGSQYAKRMTRTMRLVARLRADREFADVRVTPLLVVAKALLLALH